MGNGKEFSDTILPGDNSKQPDWLEPSQEPFVMPGFLQADNPAYDPFVDQPKPVGDAVRKMVDQLMTSITTLGVAYQAIDERALKGSRITGEDFLAPEHTFDEGEKNATKLADLEMIYDSPLVQSLAAKITGHDIPPIAPEVGLYEMEKIVSPGTPSPYKPASMLPLDAAFEREYLDNAPKKNVTLDPATHDEAGLMADLLKNNPGIALGDDHTRTAAVDLLSRNMATLKANHVDTIYVEAPQVKEWDHLSAAELRRLARDGHYRDIILPDAKSWAKAYGVPHSDDYLPAFVTMMAAAKENGIQIAYMDKESGPARDLETMPHRIASDNFIWTDFIKQDRKGKAADDKYIVFGGWAHFAHTLTDNGMVSRALGIPLLAYQKGDKATSPAFLRDDNPNGADFYLPGGNDYMDVKALLWPPLQLQFDPLTDPLMAPTSPPLFDWKEMGPGTPAVVPYHFTPPQKPTTRGSDEPLISN